MATRRMAQPPSESAPPTLCFECDQPVATGWRSHTFPYGSGDRATEITVEIPVRRCKSCGFEFSDGEAEEIKHEAVCRHLGLLSPNGIRAIRGMHGMSRAAFSRVSGIGEATLNRWENGLLVQNRANDRFLRLLASPENVRKLQSLDSERIRAGDVHVDRFRAIHVSEQLRQQQASFRIQCVA